MKSANTIQRAPDGTCQYISRDDAGRLCECGQPAAWRGRKNGRLLYCDAHGRLVGRSLEVIALAADAEGRRETLKPWREHR